MTAATRPSRRQVSEETVAAARVVLGLTIAVGGMAGTIGIVNGQPMGLIAIPSAILLVAILARAVVPAGWAGAVVWAGILPAAHAEAVIGPLAMIAACLAIAIGPERLASLVARDVRGSRPPDDAPGAGWIEEDGGPPRDR
jgi:hypothetical protein